MSEQSSLISLEDARNLVLLLEQEDINGANNLFKEASQSLNQPLFDEVGKLTRQLHTALADFHFDERLSSLTTHDIPDAKERLNYVIGMTEQAANRTMDAVEESLPLADAMQDKINQVRPRFEQLMKMELQLDQFKPLCYDLSQMLQDSNHDVDRLKELLNQVLMAQDFQDLTGQVIRKVIDLVCEVELSLVELLQLFGNQIDCERAPDQITAEGPVVAASNRVEVVNGQDEVDDLLSSLGF